MEKGYMISDASKMLEVENHVLRYWEEIGRASCRERV